VTAARGEDAAPALEDPERARRDWRTLNAARRVGYRLLPGDLFSYVLHMRPREWPIMAGHTTLGFVLAVGLQPALHGERLGALGVALLVVVVLVNGGTLAINSAYDRDAGDVGYLDAPPPVPRHLVAFSLALIALGVVVAALVGGAFLATTLVCAAMSLLYSVPPVRLKAVAGADWLINMLGFGTLTPYAGWSVTGRPLTDVAAWTLAGFCPLFAALYPLTQLYQLDEDRARGDRTLALVVGVGPSLALSVVATLAAFACFARATALADASAAGVAGIALALVAWLAALGRWLVRHRRMAPGDHKRGMYLALGAWALTDLAIVAALAV